jgi:hypothetical protein
MLKSLASDATLKDADTFKAVFTQTGERAPLPPQTRS